MESSLCVILVSLVIGASIDGAFCHVALTYPPARKYDLDFLDNSRTKPPCGMPKGNIRTSFLAGSKFTVHWHLAYAHRGGFSLRILDELERPVLDLTPRAGDTEFVRDDFTAQKYEVQLPGDFTCGNCTLQLQREAGEWGGTYRFWSCADIDIVDRKDYHETCSGHGFHILGRCKCNKMYSGPRCQFADECSDDPDCGLRGKCIDINATESPTKMCYCPYGFYGKGCNKKAPWKDKKLNLGAYSKKELSKNFHLYWKVLKEEEELELIMIVNGTSYVGIGWRPSGITKQCRNFPVLGLPLDTQTTSVQAAEPKPEPEPIPEPKAESEPSAEPEPIPEPKAEPEPSPEPKAEPEPRLESKIGSDALPEPSAEPAVEHDVRTKLISEPKPELDSISEPKAEPEPSPEPSKESQPDSEPTGATVLIAESKGPTTQTFVENDNRNKRVAMHSLDGLDFKDLGNDVTVKTSVSYKISSSKGRRRRAVDKANDMDPSATVFVDTHDIVPPLVPISTSDPDPAAFRQPSSEPFTQRSFKLMLEPKPKQMLEPDVLLDFEPKSVTLGTDPKPSEISLEPKVEPELSSESPSLEMISSSEPFSMATSISQSNDAVKIGHIFVADSTSKSISQPKPELKPISEYKYTESPLEPQAEPEPTTVSKVDEIIKSGLEPKAEPEPALVLKITSELEPLSEPTSEPEPVSEPKPEPEPVPQPTSQLELNLEPKPEPEPMPAPAPEPSTELELGSGPSLEPSPEPSLESKPEPESGTLLVKGLKEDEDTGYYPAHGYVPQFDFSPMDCTDIVAGTARGNYHRVLDYYTRDRSTPRVDTFWGGHDDITASSGFEENGVTTILFRRKIKANEPTDHSLVDDWMHVIWAVGQEPARGLSARPTAPSDRSSAGVGDFYRQDELKYHGHGAQRGVAKINFFEETKTSLTSGVLPLENNRCGGQWKYPAGCDHENGTCEYHARWEYLGQRRGKDSVRFTVRTRNSKQWTGIGFSDNKKMSQTDAVIGWVDPRNNQPFIMDTWVTGYSAPRVDQKQSVTKESGSLIDGYTTLTFVRKRDTQDNQDLAFTDTRCLYLMFVVQGGGFDPSTKRMSKHQQTPLITEERVCIKPCGPEPPDEELTTQAPPGVVAYRMLIRITGLANSFKPPAVGSAEFQELSTQVLDSLTKDLSRGKGYHGLQVDGFMQNETESIIAELTLKSVDSNTIEGSNGRSLDGATASTNDTAPEEESDLAKWEKVIRETLAEGKVGSLTVDPEFLVFEPQSLVSSEEPPQDGTARAFFGLSGTKLIVVAACVLALLLLALLQAACTLYGTRTGARKGKDQLIPHTAWKDYSNNTNYGFEPFENDDKYTSTASTAPLRPGRRPPAPGAPGGGPQRPADPPPPRPSSVHKMAAVSNGNKMAAVSNGTKMATEGRGAGARYNSAERYYQDTRSLQRPRGQFGYPGAHSTHSLPRGAGARVDPQPDFYFMPSQRKYEDF